MSDELDQAATVSEGDSPDSPTVDAPNFDDHDDTSYLGGDKDDSPPEEEHNTNDQEKTGEAETDKLPFHKHPDWIKREEEHKQTLADLKTNFETQLAVLQGKLEMIGKSSAPEQKQTRDYVDVNAMSNEQILEGLDTDARGFFGNVAKQIFSEVKDAVLKDIESTNGKNSARGEFEAFAKDHPDFKSMVESGKIEQYRKERPWASAKDAYYALTKETRAAAQKNAEQEKIDAAVKEALDKERKQQRAKKKTRVLGDGPNANKTTSGVPEELQKTNDVVGTIAERLKRMRRKAA